MKSLDSPKRKRRKTAVAPIHCTGPGNFQVSLFRPQPMSSVPEDNALKQILRAAIASTRNPRVRRWLKGLLIRGEITGYGPGEQPLMR